MKIKNILTLALTLICIASAYAASRQQVKNKPVVASACPAVEPCPDFCVRAERAADRRISFWQDPLLAEQLNDEYEALKEMCIRQNPTHHFSEERALAQQEMAEVD